MFLRRDWWDAAERFFGSGRKSPAIFALLGIIFYGAFLRGLYVVRDPVISIGGLAVGRSGDLCSNFQHCLRNFADLGCVRNNRLCLETDFAWIADCAIDCDQLHVDPQLR